MTYSILTEAEIRASIADQQPEERAYSVLWTEDGDLEDWTTFVGIDVVGAWNNFLFGTKLSQSGSFIGPSSNFTPVDAFVNDRIFFRMKYDKHPKNTSATNLGKVQWITTSDPIFNDEKSISFTVVPDGKWVLYELNMGESNKWVGDITSVRFFPCENGARNDEFFLNFFEIGTTDFTFSFDNIKAGTPGSVLGGLDLTGPITITQGVNDKLIVNIDGYGSVQITLTPQTATANIIARDISLQLTKVDIGGYIRAGASIENQRMKIESGIRGSSSSVQVLFGNQTAATTLGFHNGAGTFIGQTTGGTAPDSQYAPLSAYRPNTLEILSLFDNDIELAAFSLDPEEPVIQAGRPDYALTNRKLRTEIVTEGRGTDFTDVNTTTFGTLDFQSETFIDVNHPFTDDGEVEAIFANGVLDTAGGTKWKIFRPNFDGTLTLRHEGVIGQTNITENPAGGLVLTAEPGVFTVNVAGQNIDVKRGDLLGIFNASLHAGSSGPAKPNALYYAISGDAAGTITPPPPSGAGEAGLPIYARGSVKKNRAVIDIDLKNRLNLDKITIIGSEETRDLEYNLAIANSSVFNTDVTGNHTICWVFDLITSARTCFQRNNVGFNVQALNDNILFADNGITSFGSPANPITGGGLGGATVPGATYFYINGDAEHLGTFELALRAPQRYDFFRDPFGIECIFSQSTPQIDKPIGKAVIYFKDKKNQRSWQIETAVGNGGNGSKQGFQLIPEEDITLVRIDNKDIVRLTNFVTGKSSGSLADILLRNPVILDAFAGGIRNPQQGVDFEINVGELGGVDNLREQATFIDFQWNRFEWNFNAIRTKTFRWFTDFHFSSKISEFQVFGVSESKEALGDNVQVLFSVDGENFTSAALVDNSETKAEFKLGNSPQFLRLIFRPVLPLTIDEVSVKFEEDQVCFGEEGRLLGSLSIDDARIGSTGQATPLLVTNNTNLESDLLVDLPADIESARQLLYFSKLNSAADVEKPQVGPPGKIDFTPDRILKEEKNVAINAQSYGLLNLASNTGLLLTDNLLVNGDFETGFLSPWDLTITTSGTDPVLHQPRVFDLTDPADPAAVFQSGDFVFGLSIDEDVPAHENNFAEIRFFFGQTVNVTTYAENIDTGGAKGLVSFKYVSLAGGGKPLLRFMGSPTLLGINAPAGTTVNTDYGSNLLRSFELSKSANGSFTSSNTVIQANYEFNIKKDTRFVRLEINVPSANEAPGAFDRQKWLFDNASLVLQLPAPTTAKWYKSWRDGIGDFRNARFDEVREFVAITGSDHWYQPWDSSNIAGVPNGGSKTQLQLSDNAFSGDRFLGVQSFKRMTTTDPGQLSCQWAGEKEIIGFRVCWGHNPNTFEFEAENYPRRWQFEVLKTKAELGGVDPDINTPGHFKVVTERVTSAIGIPDPEVFPSTNISADAPFAKIYTYLLNSPVTTEGMRLTFLINCDKFERDLYPDRFSFSSLSTCPSNNQLIIPDFISRYGISLSYLLPLEDIGHTDLPIDNTVEADRTNNIYVAADLGRHHALELNSDLFELIADTRTQGQFNTSSVIFGDENTSDPNLVTWTGSVSNARWVRFVTSSDEHFEPEVLNNPGTDQPLKIPILPQSTLNQARIYPNIRVKNIPFVGANNSWQALGTLITDNIESTFIYYSDWPIIAIDFGREYLLSSVNTPAKPNHPFVISEPEDSDDKQYWVFETENNFTYPPDSARDVSDPSKVLFQTYGVGVPSNPVRWVAFKGDLPLLQSDVSTDPKSYNIRTNGQLLFQSNFRPSSSEILTENSNWFSTGKAFLRDISTFEFTLGIPFSVLEGVDYGSTSGALEKTVIGSAQNLGTPYNAFDGIFNPNDQDIWGVSVRDALTGVDNTDNAFPHSIWRQFRDPYRGDILTKNIRAITVLGLNEDFYPTDFKFQKLKDSSTDPSLNISWEDITNASFTGIDTYKDGFGFTHIFPEVISTRGIRLRISDSVYPDDSQNFSGIPVDADAVESGGLASDSSGPQTRLSSMTIFEEVIDSPTVTGTLETNQALFGTVTSLSSTPGHPITSINDGKISTFWQSPGFQDTITINLPAAREISRLEIEKDSQLGFQSGLSTNMPSDFTLKAVVGGNSTTILTETGFIGSTFNGVLSSPVTSATFTLDITKVQGQNEGANSIQISELRLIEITEQVEPLVTIGDATAQRPGGTTSRSTKLIYAAGSEAVATISLDGMDAGNDEDWSKRDFFSFWMQINNIQLLDVNFGSIRIGNSGEIFYEWDISDLSLVAGWNEIKLQFRTAPEQSLNPFQTGAQFTFNADESKVDFITPSVEVTTSVDGSFAHRVEEASGIRFFEIQYRGVSGNQPLELILSDFRFARNNFDDVCKFNSGLYLNNSELFTLNLNGLDLASGAVHFWFCPDWDTAARIKTNDFIVPSLFRIIQPDNKFLNLLYRPNQGFVVLIFDGEKLVEFITDVSLYRFNKFDTFHVGLVWDVNRGISPQGAALAFYINGEGVFGSERTWNATREAGNTVLFGGEMNQRFAAPIQNATARTFTPIPSLPTDSTASIWGVIENLKIYNYPNVDFSTINEENLIRNQLITPSQMVEISTDNITFHGVGSVGLPLSVNNVPSGETAIIYVRTNIPDNLTGEEQRAASLLVRWKTPLQECD